MTPHPYHFPKYLGFGLANHSGQSARWSHGNLFSFATILVLLLRDQSSSIQENAEAVRVFDILRDFGFIGDASGKAIMSASSTTVTIPIQELGEIYRRESRNLNIYNLIPYLESWAASVTSGMRHILFLDGLDSIFLNDDQYDQSLSSLVQAAYALNQKLRDSRAAGSIVLLLGTTYSAHLPYIARLSEDERRPFARLGLARALRPRWN